VITEHDFLARILERVTREPHAGAPLTTDVLTIADNVGSGVSSRVLVATLGAAAFPTSAQALAESELFEFNTPQKGAEVWDVHPPKSSGDQVTYVSHWGKLGLSAGNSVVFTKQLSVTTVDDITSVVIAGSSYAQVHFDTDPKLPVDGAEAMIPSQRAGLSGLTSLAIDQKNNRLILDGVHPGLRRGDIILIEYDGTLALNLIDKVAVVQVKTSMESVGGEAEDLSVPATRILLYSPLNPSWDSSDKYVIHYNLVRAGHVFPAPAETIDFTAFENGSPVTGPGIGAQGKYAIVGADGRAAIFDGAVLSTGSELRFLATELLQGDGEYKLPAKLYGPLVEATRGEAVASEILGSGDASIPFQSFTLRKSPLTYLADPSAANGRRSSLTVSVNGRKWEQAQTFYGATPTDQIYVVTHDANNNTTIRFGDGEFGARVPSGINNVVASYRHGVGGNVEANAIKAFKKPVKGITKVFNPLPSSGGEDPPTAAEAREKGIQSLRVLGRLVSLLDFQVEAARYGGVMQARASWIWDDGGEDATVHVWIITADDGDPSEALRGYLLGLAEPEVQCVVQHAHAVVGAFELDLEIDPRYEPNAVSKAVLEHLFHPFEGMFALRNVGIGGYLHRSQLYAAIHAVEGVLGVNEVMVNKTPMRASLRLEPGQYLDLLNEPISVNGAFFSANVDGEVTLLPPNLELPVPPPEEKLAEIVWLLGKWVKPPVPPRQIKKKPKRARGKAPLPKRAAVPSYELITPLGMKE
jgi:hypothetical protein